MSLFSKIIKFKVALLIILIAVVAGGVATYFALNRKKITILEGKVDRVETMVRLSTVEIYNETPVLDTINNKVICAIQKQRGSISFDIEKLNIDSIGDTIRIALPKEIVDIKEATEPSSWRVIDTKAIGNFAIIKSDKLTNAEENIVKKRLAARAVRNLYRNGTVKRARAEAAVNLHDFAEKIYRKPVVVYY